MHEQVDGGIEKRGIGSVTKSPAQENSVKISPMMKKGKVLTPIEAQIPDLPTDAEVAREECSPVVLVQVRVIDFHRAARLLSLFEDEGCRMVKMSCEEHDRHAAGSQFVTHLTGRLLSKLRLQSQIEVEQLRAQVMEYEDELHSLEKEREQLKKATSTARFVGLDMPEATYDHEKHDAEEAARRAKDPGAASEDEDASAR